MKPDFALSLSFDGIGLLLRAPQGWLRVGEVSLHVGDLAAELGDLRRAGEGLATGDFATKLVIPDDQIRYLELDTGEVTDEVRARMIRDSLDGATPYPVEDLVFDFAVDGPTTRVAAVARETLREAEAFAVEHGFRPLAFVATPQSARFGPEVFFGETVAASDLLAEGATVARDAAPIEIVGNAPPPPKEPEEAAEPDEAEDGKPPAPHASAETAQEDVPVVPETQNERAPDEPATAEADPGAPPATGQNAAAEQDAEASLEDTPQEEDAPQKASSAEPDPPAPDAAQTPTRETTATGLSDTPPPETPQEEPHEAGRQPEEGMASESASPAEAEAPAETGPLAASEPDGDPNADAETDLAQNAKASPEEIDEKSENPAKHSPDESAARAAPEPDTPPLRFSSVRARRDGGTRSEPPLTAPAPGGGVIGATVAEPSGAQDTPEPDPEDSVDEARSGGIAGFLSRRKPRREDPAAAAPSAAARVEPTVSAPSAPEPAQTSPNPPQAGDPQRRLAAVVARRDAPAADPADTPDPALDDASDDPQVAGAQAEDSETRPASDRIADLLARRDETAPAPIAADPRLAARLAAPQDEAQRMTVFGARRAAQEVGGKPRHLGLFLTLALIAFMAGVAAFGAIFSEGGLARLLPGGADRTTVTALPEPDARGGGIESIDLPAPDTASPQPSPSPAAQEPAPDRAPETAALPPAPEALPDPAPGAGPRPGPLAGRAPSADEASARYAATGIWQRAPARPALPALIGKDGLVLTSIDRDIPQFDSVARPAPAPRAADIPMQAPADPPPPGARFDLDARGLVIPTPEGAVTPQGVLVYQGPPPARPPARDAGPETAPDGQVDAEPETAAPEAAAQQGQPDIPRIRPRSRPAGLAPAAPPATAEETETDAGEETDPDGGTGTPAQEAPAEVADVADIPPPGSRPRPRPESVLARAAAAEAASAAGAASTAPAQEAVDTSQAVAAALLDSAAPDQEALEDEAEVTSASPLAVASSLAPPARPRDFEDVVEEAREESREVRTAAVAPRAVSPSVPSNASVARQATVENAINLRRVNLIGVYGQPSNRRALVRLPNGRYEKVQVGDRLDGGRIAAIGEDELRYTKNGRSLVLRMPQG